MDKESLNMSWKEEKKGLTGAEGVVVAETGEAGREAVGVGGGVGSTEVREIIELTRLDMVSMIEGR